MKNRQFRQMPGSGDFSFREVFYNPFYVAGKEDGEMKKCGLVFSGFVSTFCACCSKNVENRTKDWGCSIAFYKKWALFYMVP